MEKELNVLEENKQTALAVSLAILDGRWSELDNLLDKDFTYTGDGFVFTKDEYIGFMQDMKSAFSNLKMTFPAIVAEGDMVSIRFISTAVNTGSFMGAPANKKNLEVNGIFMRKVKDGKVMQEWQTTDLLGVMSQIGAGALLGYAVFVGLFKVKSKRPVRKY
jgi:predicted ester cyclase